MAFSFKFTNAYFTKSYESFDKSFSTPTWKKVC